MSAESRSGARWRGETSSLSQPPPTFYFKSIMDSIEDESDGNRWARLYKAVHDKQVAEWVAPKLAEQEERIAAAQFVQMTSDSCYLCSERKLHLRILDSGITVCNRCYKDLQGGES